MRTIETKAYKFTELSDEAKEAAINGSWEINVDHEWWEGIYDDAGMIGLKITSFDIDHSDIEGDFLYSAEVTADMALKNHGESCETFQTAETYISARNEIIEIEEKDENGDFEDEWGLDKKLDELDAEFLTDILNDFLMILGRDHEYFTSEESIQESLIANDYEFTEEGEMI